MKRTLSEKAQVLVDELHKPVAPIWRRLFQSDNLQAVFQRFGETAELAVVPHLCGYLFAGRPESTWAAAAIDRLVSPATSGDLLALDEILRLASP